MGQSRHAGRSIRLLVGEAEFAQGDFERAAKTLFAVPEIIRTRPFASPPWSIRRREARRLAADGGLAGGDERRFARAAAAIPTNASAWLLLARSRLGGGEIFGGVRHVEIARQAVASPALDWQRANLLCRVQAGMGDLAAALATTTNLLSLTRSRGSRAPGGQRGVA